MECFFFFYLFSINMKTLNKQSTAKRNIKLTKEQRHLVWQALYTKRASLYRGDKTDGEEIEKIDTIMRLMNIV